MQVFKSCQGFKWVQFYLLTNGSIRDSSLARLSTGSDAFGLQLRLVQHIDGGGELTVLI